MFNPEKEFDSENNNGEQPEQDRDIADTGSADADDGRQKDEPAESTDSEQPEQEATSADADDRIYDVKPEPERPYQYTPPRQEQYSFYSEPVRPQPEEPKKKKKGTVQMTRGTLAVIIVCCIVLCVAFGVGAARVYDAYYVPDTTTGSETATTAATTASTTAPRLEETTSDYSGTEITDINTDKSESESLAKLRESYRAVVLVELSAKTAPDKVVGGGSGVVYTKDGYIVTNFHVAGGLTTNSYVINVILEDEKYEAQYVFGDLDTDVAVLKIDKDDCPYATFGDSDKVQIFDTVYAVGNPNLSGLTATRGIVSALHRSSSIVSSNVTIFMNDLIQIDAPINAGNSGGALFDDNGYLIGIVNSKCYQDKNGNVVEGNGAAIPAKLVIDTINTLRENNGHIPGKAQIGVVISQKTLSSGFTGTTYYTYISAINQYGSAAGSDLQVGDIISAVDGVNLQRYAADNGLLNDYDALHFLLLQYKSGDTVKLTVIREEGTQTSPFGYTYTSYCEAEVEITFVEFTNIYEDSEIG
ncbi:MAG: S1C family serine protease [Clostridia bacterium]|nr:S1C family serine protease [Clostridia bacterium]